MIAFWLVLLFIAVLFRKQLIYLWLTAEAVLRLGLLFIVIALLGPPFGLLIYTFFQIFM